MPQIEVGVFFPIGTKSCCCSRGLPLPGQGHSLPQDARKRGLNTTRPYLNIHLAWQFTSPVLLAASYAAAAAHKLRDGHTSYNQTPKFTQVTEEPSFCNTILHLGKTTCTGKAARAPRVESVGQVALSVYVRCSPQLAPSTIRTQLVTTPRHIILTLFAYCTNQLKTN